MLRVTIELVPDGNECLKKVLGVMHINNDGRSQNEHVGNYEVRSMNPDGHYGFQIVTGIYRDFNIFNFLKDFFNKLDKEKL